MARGYAEVRKNSPNGLLVKDYTIPGTKFRLGEWARHVRLGHIIMTPATARRKKLADVKFLWVSNRDLRFPLNCKACAKYCRNCAPEKASQQPPETYADTDLDLRSWGKDLHRHVTPITEERLVCVALLDAVVNFKWEKRAGQH